MQAIRQQCERRDFERRRLHAQVHADGRIAVVEVGDVQGAADAAANFTDGHAGRQPTARHGQHRTRTAVGVQRPRADACDEQQQCREADSRDAQRLFQKSGPMLKWICQEFESMDLMG